MARQQARRRHKERLIGIILAMVGVAVLVVAVIAVSEPKDATKDTAADRSSGTRTVTRAAPSSTASSRGASTPKSTPKSTPTSATSGSRDGDDTSSSSVAEDVPLVVLNNTTTSGLAKTAADRFRNAGWTVSDTGNLQNDILSTCAYYDPSNNAAEDAAKALRNQFPTIKRVQPKFPELPSGPVVVVLTPDYAAG